MRQSTIRICSIESGQACVLSTSEDGAMLKTCIWCSLVELVLESARPKQDWDRKTARISDLREGHLGSADTPFTTTWRLVSFLPRILYKEQPSTVGMLSFTAAQQSTFSTIEQGAQEENCVWFSDVEGRSNLSSSILLRSRRASVGDPACWLWSFKERVSLLLTCQVHGLGTADKEATKCLHPLFNCSAPRISPLLRRQTYVVQNDNRALL